MNRRERRLIFKNSKGKEQRSILPTDVMNKIIDYTEEELIKTGIVYFRNGSHFSVEEENINIMRESQFIANKRLMEEGVLTIDMLYQDYIANI